MLGIAVRLRWGRSIGAYLRQDRLVLTEVAGTPAGVAVLGTCDLDVRETGAGKALREWLEGRFTRGQRRHLRLCVGVAAEQAFFTTRFLDISQRKGPLSSEAMLEACGAFHAWDKDGAAADCVRTRLSSGPAYSLAAVKRDLAREVLSALDAAGVRSARLEPAPWSLLRAADRQARPPRKWKLAVRVLLAEADGLAMLVADGQPVLWRRFALDALSPALSITSAIRALQIYARQHFDIRSFCGVFIQGLADGGVARRVEEETGLSVTAPGGEGLTDAQHSLALALEARDVKSRSLDLMQSLRPPPNIREIFPGKLAAFILLLGGCMALLLWNQSGGLADHCASVDRQIAAHPWAAPLDLKAIDGQRKALLAEVGAVRKFLATRIIWSNYLRDLPTRLPTNACLSSVSACCEMEEMGETSQKRKPKKSLTLSGMARFADAAGAPREIDAFLESLRGVELLKRDFPLVQPAEIKWRKEGGSEIAMFTIIAAPAARGKPD